MRGKSRLGLNNPVLHSAAWLKANWSCTACGMYSGRRYCVQRHIDNIHKGKANAIPFIEYFIGRREGLYPPKGRPSFGSKKRTIVEKTEDEIENMYARRAAETAFQFTPVGDYAYLPIITEVANNIRDSLTHPDWEKLFEILNFSQMNNKPNVEASQGTISMEAVQDDLLHNDELLHNNVDLTHCMKMLENISLNRRS